MKRIYYLLLAVLIFGVADISVEKDKYYEILKNLEIYTNVYKELNTHYVDELDPSQLMRTGVDAMVNSLDPYTNYISESQIESYRIENEGKYNGAGSVIRKIGDYATIVETYEDSPAIKAGLKIGDQIIEIEGKSTLGKTSDEIIRIMRGLPGTAVNLTIKRPFVKETFKTNLDRGEVAIPNVPHFQAFNDEVGYIALTTFTPDAGRNVEDALRSLKKDNPGLKGVILDLRSNGGGLLREAISVSNVFVPSRQNLVTTKGKVKERDRNFGTLGEPVDVEIPIVVLINKRSASASEIVAGVIQDLDRGVLVGQRSFGKGLVQNTKEVGYNSRLKLTTSKYYIPSGRCIQAVEYENGEPKDIPDSLRAKFFTRSGRPVLDGGGVAPDFKMERPVESTFVKALKDQEMIFQYVTKYVNGKETIGDVENFDFTDYDDFLSFLADKSFQYESDTELKLKEVIDAAKSENLQTIVSDKLSLIQNEIVSEKLNYQESDKEFILDLIENEIVSRFYFQKGKIEQMLKNDKEVDTAISILTDQERYKSMLKAD